MSNQLPNQQCPVCQEKKLTLTEEEIDVPYFGLMFIFNMHCSSCNFNKSDCEAAEFHDPARYTFEVTTEQDMTVRVVKSAEATVKIPHIVTIEPGEVADGYVTNIEGLLMKVKKMIESVAEAEEDEDIKKKAKRQIKKLNDVMIGRDSLKIIIEDPTGNSAIISEKSVKSKL